MTAIEHELSQTDLRITFERAQHLLRDPDFQQGFCFHMGLMAEAIRAINYEKGWRTTITKMDVLESLRDGDLTAEEAFAALNGMHTDGDLIALIHSEASEALEYLRKGDGNEPDSHCPEFPGWLVELSDEFVRIVDMADRKDAELGPAILSKVLYNSTRPWKHGKKI